MARPVIATVDYFPHFTKHGKTLFTIESKYGASGYAFWFKLLELLGSNEQHYYDCNNTACWEFLLAKTFVNDEAAYNILDLLAKLDAINSKFWQIKIIYSEKFIENIKDVYSRRKINLLTPDEIYNKCMQKYNVKYSYCIQEPTLNEVSENINPQSKVKYSKVNKSKVNNIISQNFSNFDNENNNHSDNNKNRITKNEAKLIFEECRKLYKGTKRGLDTEFKDYTQKSYKNGKTTETDWQYTVHLLKPAIEREIEYKEKLAANNSFVPEWKNFKTWISQRCWEQEFNEPNKKNGTAKQTSITKEELEKANNYLLLKGKEWNE